MIFVVALLLLCSQFSLGAQETESPPSQYEVSVIKDASNGWRMDIDGVATPIYGVVWSFTPIGENYNYNLWGEPEEYIKTVIDIDAKLMKEAGINAIRSFSTIPPKWVTYLYEEYGIYTAINYLFGRYGVSVKGKWYPRTDYSDPDVRELLVRESLATVEQYKDVPGILMFLLGNENNYGLEWTSFEIENLPQDERHREKATYLYSVFGEAVVEMKKHTDFPIGIVNGDLLYIELIAESASEIDLLAVNVYRGKRSYQPENPYSTPFFERVEEVLDRPVVYSEFGSDAYNTLLKTEDQYHQAEYLVSQWGEIFEHSYGKGNAQNALGGFVFEWMDEWWKRGLDKNLDSQETRGSWINGGYAFDFIPEQYDSFNNMNEEWLGIVAQSTEYYGGGGYYKEINKRIPRAAYYALKQIWQTNMYDISLEETNTLFSEKYNEGIDINGAVARANDIASKQRENLLQYKWLTIVPVLEGAMREHWGDYDETAPFSYEQTLNVIMEVKPTPYFGARSNIRFQYGALDDVFEDSYSYSLLYGDNKDNDTVPLSRLPVEFYSASFLYETNFIDIEGLFHDGYRVTGGHSDWVAEGDFFGLLPESFYLDDFDRSLSKAPFGMEFTFHSFLEGLKIYGGPEIFKEARPTVMGKYYREWGGFRISGVGEQEIAIPAEQDDKDGDGNLDDQLRRKASFMLGYTTPQWFNVLRVSLDAGLLFSGLEKVDEEYTASLDIIYNQTLLIDEAKRNIEKVKPIDTLSYKGRLTLDFDTNPVFSLWSEFIYAGLVSDSRAIAIRKGGFIGDIGTGNRQEVKGGLDVYVGDFMFSGNALWRTPLSDPINNNIGGIITVRDQRSDPFVVFGNRESLQAEILFTYDQTGATYFHNFDNDDKENAKFAMFLGYHHTFYNERTDALYYKNDVGGWYTWPVGLARVTNLPSAKLRLVSNFWPRNKIIVTSFLTKNQTSTRSTYSGTTDFIDPEWQYQGALTYVISHVEISPAFTWNIFGPEDWHREFGFRIPLAWKMYMAYHFDKVSILNPRQILYAEVSSRYFEGIDDKLKDAAIDAFNPLGSSQDSYRMAITIGYSLKF